MNRFSFTLCIAALTAVSSLSLHAGSNRNDDLFTSGYVSGQAGLCYLDASNQGVQEGYPRLDLNAGLSFPFSNGWSVQFEGDAFGNIVNTNHPNKSNHKGAIVGGAHVSYREAANWLAGAFGAMGAAFAEDSSTSPRKGSWFIWALGLEGQKHFGDATGYLQVGFLDARDPKNESAAGDALRDAWFARGIFRYFFGDDRALEAELAGVYGKSDDFAGDSGKFARTYLVSWGAKFKDRIRDSFWHWFIAYNGLYGKNKTESDSVHEHRGSIGVEYLFGEQTARATNHGGATLDLAPIGYWSSLTQNVID